MRTRARRRRRRQEPSHDAPRVSPCRGARLDSEIERELAELELRRDALAHVDTDAFPRWDINAATVVEPEEVPMPVPVRPRDDFSLKGMLRTAEAQREAATEPEPSPQDAPQTDLAALLDTTPDAPVDQLDAHSGAQAAPPAKSDAEFGDISAWTIDGEPQAPGAVLDIDSRPKVRPVFRPSPNTAASAPGSTTPAEAPSHPNTQTPDQANDPELDPEPAQTQTARVPPRADPPGRPATSTDTATGTTWRSATPANGKGSVHRRRGVDSGRHGQATSATDSAPPHHASRG